MSQLVPRQQSDCKMSVDDLQILYEICDEKSAILVWDDKYSGFTGRCRLCKRIG